MGNGSYSTLPASTIDLISTIAAPTDVPGENGIGACITAYTSTMHMEEGPCPGVNSYCGCDGTYVDFTTTTITASGTA
ncbi:hypothetical protein MMC12_005108 [Toensbergia leucococca]|nr:hypothetical protein [Toensbergia leucococca]